MTFKIAKAATSSADLNLKLSKPVVSPASSLSADQVAKTDLITGGKFSAAGIQEKVIAGAGTQDIARADQIIGILDRGSQSSLDQFGLHSPSVQNPGGDLKNTLDIGAYIDAYDASLRLNDVSAGADKVGYCEGAAYFIQGVGTGVSVASSYIASTVPVPQAKGVALGGFFAGLIINGAGNLLSYACTGRSTGGNATARLAGELSAEEYEASDEFVGPPWPTEKEAESPMTPEDTKIALSLSVLLRLKRMAAKIQ